MRLRFVLALFLLSSELALAQESPAIVGVWGVTTQQVNCETDANIGPPFRSLITFVDGGALFESPDTHAFQPGQRSVGHGSWTPAGRRFVTRTLTMINFETPPGTPPGSPGFKAGWQEVNNVVRITGQNSFAATGTAKFFDLTRQVYLSACSVRTGERFR
jgi:hypothetical protein